MHNVKPLAQAGLPHQLLELRVVAAAAAGAWRLSDGRVARTAVSCLVRPQAGDRVLTGAGGGEVYILHILAREPGGEAHLEAPGVERLRLEAPALELAAGRRLALHSRADLDVVCAGRLSQSAGQQFVHVAGALVESLDQHISRARDRSWDTENLLSIRGGQVLCLADGDLRMDAERINLG